MRLELNKPEGCRAEGVAYKAPGPRSPYDEIVKVSLLCGDRRTDFDSAARAPELSVAYKMKELAQFASEALCGFCVLCPNNLPVLTK